MNSSKLQDAQFGLFVFGLLVGLLQLSSFDGLGFGRGFEMIAIAKNIAAQGTFGNPFEPAITGPTAVVPPLYPIALAAIIKIFQVPGLIIFAATVSNIVVNAMGSALMPRLALIFFGDMRPGMIAGLLWTFSIRLMPQWDVSYTVAGLMVFCCLAAEAVETLSMRKTVLTGFAGGLLTLMNPATVLLSVPWVVFLLVSRGVPLRRSVRFLSCVLLVIAASNVPWLIRNYTIWNAFALRTNFGMTIYASNNDCAESGLVASMESGCYLATHPVSSQAEVRLLQELGEVEYDRMRTRVALDWIATHPERYRELTGRRIVAFWFPELEFPTVPTYVIWGVTVISIPGFLLMARRRELVAWYVLLVWLIYPLMYYNVVASDRYRYPMLWTSLLPAGYLLNDLFQRLRKTGLRTIVDGSTINF